MLRPSELEGEWGQRQVRLSDERGRGGIQESWDTEQRAEGVVHGKVHLRNHPPHYA